MKKHFLTALVLLLWVASAQATDAVFYDISWPRHDKKTGLLEWDFRARTAIRPPFRETGYKCDQVELLTYKPVDENGRLVRRKDSFLRADKGEYIHDRNRSHAILEGNVIVEFYGKDPMRVLTDKTEITSEWDSARSATRRVIRSPGKVIILGATRGLSGEGLSFEETASDANGIEQSRLVLHRNPVMTILDESGAVLPGGPAAASAGGAPVRTDVTCAGQFVYDRVKGEASFQDRVALTRGDAVMRCDALSLAFAADEAAEAARPDPTAPSKLKSMTARGNVAFTSPDQSFSGAGFEWDPDKAAGRLTGSPARMSAPGMRAVARTIEFDQKAGRVMYSDPDGAEVEIELKQ